ncbi:MAG: ATP-binding protein, partial [Chloroflexota bacterium]|nr:ATP-binding protein [Chloroflexota bacterium]
MGQDLLITSYLKRLRLSTMGRNYSRLAQEAAGANQSYESYLLALLEAEVLQREENAQRLRLARARFPVIKTLDSFEFSAIPSLNKALVVELARSSYIQR